MSDRYREEIKKCYAAAGRSMNEFVADELAWEVIGMTREAKTWKEAFAAARERILHRLNEAYEDGRHAKVTVESSLDITSGS